MSRGATEIVVFGRRPVLEALGEPDASVLEVRAARGLPTAFRRELGLRCREAGVPFEIGAVGRVRELSGEPRHDQGVAARVRLGRVAEIDAFLAERTGRQARAPTRLLALDGITNSQNIGMIARSAVAAGLDGLVWPLVGSPWVNGLVLKASAGSVYRCRILRCESLSVGLPALQAAGFTVAGLVAGAKASLFDWKPPHRSLLVVGSETRGIDPGLRELLDIELSIPMAPGVESLNVAVAASLACFHGVRAARS